MFSLEVIGIDFTKYNLSTLFIVYFFINTCGSRAGTFLSYNIERNAINDIAGLIAFDQAYVMASSYGFSFVRCLNTWAHLTHEGFHQL
jgi:hypothetical protein